MTTKTTEARKRIQTDFDPRPMGTPAAERAYKARIDKAISEAAEAANEADEAAPEEE